MLTKVEVPTQASSFEDHKVLETAGAAFASRQAIDTDKPYRIIFGDGTFAQFDTLDAAQDAWEAVEMVLTRPYWQANPYYQMKFSPVRLEYRLGWAPVMY